MVAFAQKAPLPRSVQTTYFTAKLTASKLI
jgi:hypothetical protein